MRRFGAAPSSRAGQASDDAHASSGTAAPSRNSLRARALALLAMRDYSVAELTRKLAPHAESPEQLEALLAEFTARGLVSNARFAESLVRRRAERYGVRRIAQELGQHGLDADTVAPLMRDLAAGERERALAVWRKRFGAPPVDLAERAKQQRFLAQRGFSAEVIAWVHRHASDASEPSG